MQKIFFILAAIFFALSALNIDIRINTVSAGFCCVTIGLWLV